MKTGVYAKARCFLSEMICCRGLFTSSWRFNCKLKKYALFSYNIKLISTTFPQSGSFNRQTTSAWAQRILFRLSPKERSLLYEELSKEFRPNQNTLENNINGKEVNPVTLSQLRMVVAANTLPFIGFGFLDNAIMIMAGEYIDLTFASILGISTMAGRSKYCNLYFLAAGLGNWVSDLFGIGMVGYVERFTEKIGISTPTMTPSQYSSSPVRWATVLGRIVGITIGCWLGLFPLFWFDKPHETKMIDPD